MSKKGGYTFTTDEAKQVYRFTSTGPSGDIQKIVTISPAYGSAWNFAFGDATGDGDEFDDEAVSNNCDIRKVLQTLANIIYDFLEEHPDLELVICPVDTKRRNLYNRVFQLNFEFISTDIVVFGVFNNLSEQLYHAPTKHYQLFILSKKTTNFDKNN